MSTEARARITINKLLEEAGWRFLPDTQGQRENIICEHRITRRALSPSQDLGKDFEHAPNAACWQIATASAAKNKGSRADCSASSSDMPRARRRSW